jgi:hypothetical protein
VSPSETLRKLAQAEGYLLVNVELGPFEVVRTADLSSAAADKKRQEFRLEAYQQTCHTQGSKLNQLATLLMSESVEAESGMDVTLLSIDVVHFKCDTLRSIQEILKRS